MKNGLNKDDSLKQFEELKRQSLIFEKILDISEDGFLIIDDNEKIININKAYCDFLGLDKEKIIGKPVLDIIKNSKLPQILSTGEIDIDVIHKLVRGQASNNEKYVFVARAPVKNKDNKIIAAVGQVKFSLKTVALAKKLQDLDMQLQYYKKELTRVIGNQYSFENIIGRSNNFLSVKKIGEKASRNDFTVLINGETGTGKEVFAHAIHLASNRRNKPFVKINCAAIPSQLLESELFGYEEGSFTGAKRGGKKGKFEFANGGTIFLDEIGDMPLDMQAKLLRVLQEREIEKIGDYKTIPVDVRVIAATNQDLSKKIKDGSFREDLYYRLNVIQINIPSLKERSDDIELFVNYFLDELNEKYETNVEISAKAKKVLVSYSWPGNVRELRNAIYRAYALVDENIILKSHLPTSLLANSKINMNNHYKFSNRNLETILQEFEKEIILEVLKKNSINRKKTAEELGIHRVTLYKKLEKLNINSESFE
ncbi:PAS domain S-box protein [Alkaliphilus pronyensis]|uniref:PAS domain S-box protein n=1 Tax=Alkaliphilus pronyensis TaxID=1482732 RepID=A0A6I0F2N1_9FIRM|nr:sigma 54-interacting transcriptional regulator [Alkaliphilus pronyensis]KAB3532145.1 PAS domain S-box protein [Alkaliphilus pronyensis]